MHVKGFRHCLAEYTVHSLSPCYGLLTALMVLSSVARCCNATHFLMVFGGFFPGEVRVGGQSDEIWFLPLGTMKTTFLLKFSNFCHPFRHPCLCGGKCSCHTIIKLE